MNMLMITIMMASILATVVLVVSITVPIKTTDQEKLSPYECGFTPKSNTRIPFSIRFFYIAILFIMFDLEIALLLPWPLAMNNSLSTTPLLTASSIIIVLTISLLLEWETGALEWAE
uniref:NADH-ubiquinone oxidoreductase chain 3 n=1 Tax=Xenoturbella profunda TaxID=1736633 RepID=A0A0U2VY74_9BILA|nr:NADH dehydrogenase subunit 3 [Xenoturbella profunda]ALS20097.1 NADH dehydrogenase subunit 3 [Xenoturbella profunda]